MAIPGAGPLPQPTKKALAAQKRAANVASLSNSKKGQDPAATVVEVTPKHKDDGANGRPDKSVYDKEQDALRAEIDQVQAKLNDLRNKISTSSVKGGPHHERKIELRKQLDQLRSEQQQARGGRGKTVEQLSTMQEALKKKIAELQTAKAKVPYKTVQDVDNQIKNLDRQVESGTMKLVDEKKALNEISQLRKSRKTVESFSTLQASIDNDKSKIDQVRAQLDDPEQKRIDEQFKALKLDLDEVNKKMDEQSKTRDSLFDERNELSQQLDQLLGKKKASAQAFREANNKYYDKLNAERAKRDERRREERKAQETSRRDEINQQLLEEAQAPAFEREIEDCRNLILFFQQRIGQAQTSSSSNGPSSSASLFERPQVGGVPKLELRRVEQELPKGAVLRKKGQQDEQDETGWGGNGGKSKKKSAQAAAKKEGSNEGQTSEQLLNLPFGTLAALMSLGITAPLTTKEVPQTIENLEKKKKYFVDNQGRVTKERVAAVEKKIAAALESSTSNGNGKRSNGTSTPPVAPEIEAVAHAEPTATEQEVQEGAEEVAAPQAETSDKQDQE
ncbi:uncharacterized protein JCM15063_004603 [Sporobolomyces koalae]|uniref:uncharacterized protein n=1 Tax=Sporobolomyces koalae TaxID=500713 RepID=UPI00317F661B